MITDLVWQRQFAKVFAAFEALDAERLVRFWPEDAVLEFPAGTPMAGEWRGREEITALFRAVFAHNASIRITPRHFAVHHPWSPRGRMTVFAEWTFTEVGVDGDVYTSDVVSVAELRRWKTVRSRDYFFNVPGNQAHYAAMLLPPRRVAQPVASTRQH